MTSPIDALRAATLAALPGLTAPRLVFCRVVRDLAGRLSLQRVTEQDEAPDALPVEVWPGVPGVTSDPTPGEIVMVALVGADQAPAVVARAPKGEPGHTPVAVRLDAVTELRLLGELASSAAKARVGSDAPPPAAVALAPNVAATFAQVEVALTAIAAYAAAVAVVSPATLPAATALASALGDVMAAIAANAAPYPVGYSSTRLEAQ